MAVALAMVAARAGRPRLRAMAVIVAALALCSGVKVTARPSAAARQDGSPRLVMKVE